MLREQQAHDPFGRGGGGAPLTETPNIGSYPISGNFQSETKTRDQDVNLHNHPIPQFDQPPGATAHYPAMNSEFQQQPNRRYDINQPQSHPLAAHPIGDVRQQNVQSIHQQMQNIPPGSHQPQPAYQQHSLSSQQHVQQHPISMFPQKIAQSTSSQPHNTNFQPQNVNFPPQNANFPPQSIGPPSVTQERAPFMASVGGMHGSAGNHEKAELKWQEYVRQLDEQVRMKKERTQKEREKLHMLDLKHEREMMAYNPFGKAGAGAPIRDSDGQIMATYGAKRTDKSVSKSPTTVKEVEETLHIIKPPSSSDASKVGPLSPTNAGQFTRFRHSDASPERQATVARAQKQQDDYQRALAEQVSAKKRREEEIRRKEKEEEDRLEEKIRQDQAELAATYAEELNSGKSTSHKAESPETKQTLAVSPALVSGPPSKRSRTSKSSKSDDKHAPPAPPSFPSPSTGGARPRTSKRILEELARLGQRLEEHQRLVERRIEKQETQIDAFRREGRPNKPTHISERRVSSPLIPTLRTDTAQRLPPKVAPSRSDNIAALKPPAKDALDSERDRIQIGSVKASAPVKLFPDERFRISSPPQVKPRPRATQSAAVKAHVHALSPVSVDTLDVEARRVFGEALDLGSHTSCITMADPKSTIRRKVSKGTPPTQRSFRSDRYINECLNQVGGDVSRGKFPPVTPMSLSFVADDEEFVGRRKHARASRSMSNVQKSLASKSILVYAKKANGLPGNTSSVFDPNASFAAPESATLNRSQPRRPPLHSNKRANGESGIERDKGSSEEIIGRPQSASRSVSSINRPSAFNFEDLQRKTRKRLKALAITPSHSSTSSYSAFQTDNGGRSYSQLHDLNRSPSG
eukprot:189254_1